MNFRNLALSLMCSAAIFLLAGGCAARKVDVASPYKDYFESDPSLAKVEAETKAESELPMDEFEWQKEQPGQAAKADATKAAVERVLVLPTVPDVDQRMSVYADKLSSWESLAAQLAEYELTERRPARWDGCLATIKGLFRDYSMLMEALLKQDHPAVNAEHFGVDPWLIYGRDIAFLEGECGQTFASAVSMATGWGNRYSGTGISRGEALVSQYAINGRYQEAVVAFQSLVSGETEQQISADTRRMYGFSLLKTGQLEKAADVLSQALEGMSPSPEERSLRRLVADLLLASGRLNDSRVHYRKLADYFESRKGDDRWVADQLALLGEVNLKARELPLYMDVLKGYIAFDDRHIPPGMKELVERMQDDYPRSSLTARARQMLAQIEDSIREGVAIKLDQVDTLLVKNDYTRAKSILEQMLVDELPAEMRDSVQRAMDDLLLGEVNYQAAQQVVMEQTLSEQWDKAVWLLDARKYDKAIGAFSPLFNTEYDAPARAKIQEAAEAASVEMRRKAASFFVKARKERDYNRKRELFRESWQLLNDITVKYPEVKLIDKVRQNLVIIEEQIELFDPALLRELKMVSGFKVGGLQ